MSSHNKNILFIAEIGHNHNGNMKLAKKMIESAKECGADIAKFQLYDTDYIIQPNFKHYWELKATQLSREQLKELFNECQKVEIEFMTSVFDTKRVKWTEELGMKRYKIASVSIHDKKLIKTIEKTGKPIIASLGTWNNKYLPRFKADFLYCVSKYPAKDLDLWNFPEKFDKYAGFSDHTIGLKWIKLAIVRGARIIEKHFTLDKNLIGTDQAGSANPDELREIIKEVRRWEKIRKAKTLGQMETAAWL